MIQVAPTCKHIQTNCLGSTYAFFWLFQPFVIALPKDVDLIR